MNKLFCCLFAFLTLTGCGRIMLVDFPYITQIEFKNNSTHTITINPKNPPSYFPESFTILPGERYMFSDGVEGGCYLVAYTPFECEIVFDGTVSIVHKFNDGSLYHNICSTDSYIETSREKYKQTYRFVFSDDDYELAVNGVTTN